MKRITLPFIFLLLITSANAQLTNKPWALFPFGQVSYYKSADRSFYTLSADSSLIVGSDTIVYMNRKLFPGEPLCSQPGASTWNNAYYYYPYTFISDSFISNSDTIKFYEDTTDFSVWNFNQPLFAQLNLLTNCGGAIYSYDSAYYDTQIGDSARTISLFTSLNPSVVYQRSVFVNTKYHGLLLMGLNNNLSLCSTGGAYSLCGFSKGSTQWGFYPPTTQQYLNYHAGDVMVYYNHQYDPFNEPSSGYERDSIISVETSGDSVKLFMRTQTENITYSNFIDSTSITRDTTATEGYFIPDFSRITNRTTLEPAFTNDTSLDEVFQVTLSEDTGFCVIDTTIAIEDVSFLLNNCVAEQLVDGIPMWNYYSTVYGYKGYFNEYLQSDGYAYSTLIGYRSIARNINCGDYFPLGVKTIATNERINIFPNPASNIVYISLSQNLINSEAIIYDIMGVEYKRMTINNQILQLDVSDFHSGMYFIRVIDGSSGITGKFSVIK